MAFSSTGLGIPFFEPALDGGSEGLDVERQFLMGRTVEDRQVRARGAGKLEFLHVLGGRDAIVVGGDEECVGRAGLKAGEGVQGGGRDAQDGGNAPGGSPDHEPGDAWGEFVADPLDGRCETRVGGDGDGRIKNRVGGGPSEGDRAAVGDAEDDDRAWKAARGIEMAQERVEVLELGGAEGYAASGGASVTAQVHEDGMPSLVSAEEGPGEHGTLREGVPVEQDDGALGLMQPGDGKGGNLPCELEPGHGASMGVPVGGLHDGIVGRGRNDAVGKAGGVFGKKRGSRRDE